MSPRYDSLIEKVADYVHQYDAVDTETLNMARYAMLDAIGCGVYASALPDCRKLLGPTLSGQTCPGGVSSLDDAYGPMDPIQAAFNISVKNRWVDFNDTYLALEWGHPSDNLGAILAAAQVVSNQRVALGRPPLAMREVLGSLVQTYEIQGCLSDHNAFNAVGLDHVLLVKAACAAVSTRLMGGDRDAIASAFSQAFADSSAIRVYRHFPNTNSRKSWAAGDASARGLQLAMWAMRGEPGIPTVLTAPKHGFNEVCMRGAEVRLPCELRDAIMRRTLFKVRYATEFHAQTAVEAALALRPQVLAKSIAAIAAVRIVTHSAAIRIISKAGALKNPADRDHCIEYIVAVALIFGDVRAEHYEDAFAAANPAIDELRAKITCVEDAAYSAAYLDPAMRAIPNAIQIRFQDGVQTEVCAIDYPIGHIRRRAEALPEIRAKFVRHLSTRYAKPRAAALASQLWDLPIASFLDMTVGELVVLFSDQGWRPLVPLSCGA